MDYCYKTKNLSVILKNTINLIEKEELNVNWFIKLICYNYASLTILHECTLGQLQLEEHIKNLQSAAKYLNEVIILTNKHCSKSSELWDGYAQYNLCRVYQSLYNVDDVEKKPFYLEEITKTSYKAIESRKRLIYANFKGIFSNAILFEYFLALKNKYEFNMHLEGYAYKDKIIEQIDNTMIELNKYCEISGLIKLINLREQLCNMKEEVKKAHNESDNINNQ